MDIQLPIWECCPQGHPIGGAGLFLKLKDMAKLGQLFLDRGRWNNEQLIPERWVAEASVKRLETPMPEEMKKARYPENPWSCGYGYQLWMCPYEGAYRADGAFGQITMVLPKQGMVISFQCPEDGNFSLVQQAVDEMLLQLI